jgi:hypothetical protein
VFPATVAASVLTMAGGFAAVHLVAASFGHPVLRVGVLHALTWKDPAVLGAGGGLSLAGLLFVLSAALPGRTGTEALAGDDPGFVTGLTRSSLRAILRAAARDVTGVTGARVRLYGRLRPRVRVRVVTDLTDPGNLEEHVAYVVRERLASLGPVRVPEVGVRVVAGKGS